ncbi:Protein of unknown function [Bacillus wiedmannii]|uniref:Uncharacterized protein n=1 Tax=Bacillus wiedmannii TaxID=1890302 RepID=A0AB37YQQ1_9BACI|nr:Protein of unknown function [Bacillus wiedmannii]
MSLEKRYLF